MTVVTREGRSSATAPGISVPGPRVTTTMRVPCPGTRSASSVPNARQKSWHVEHPAVRNARRVVPGEPSSPTRTAPPPGETPVTSNSRPRAVLGPGAATPSTVRTAGSPRERAKRLGRAEPASWSSPPPRSWSARSTSAWLRSRPMTSTASRATTTPSDTIAAVIAEPAPARSRYRHAVALGAGVRPGAHVGDPQADLVGTRTHGDGHVEAVRSSEAQGGEVGTLEAGDERCDVGVVAADVRPDRRRRVGVDRPPGDADPAAAERGDRVDAAERAPAPRDHPRPDQAVEPGPDVDGPGLDLVAPGRERQLGVEPVPPAPGVLLIDLRTVDVGRQLGAAATVVVDVHRYRAVGVGVDRPAPHVQLAEVHERGLEAAERVVLGEGASTADARVADALHHVDRVGTHVPVAGADVADHGVEAVIGARPRVGARDIGPAEVGRQLRPSHVVDVDVHGDGARRVGIDRPAPDAQSALDGRHRVEPAVRVPGEARAMVVARGVVDPHRRAARRIGLPGWDAADHPAHDRAEAADILVALAVAEAVAADPAVAAGATGASTPPAGAAARADAAAAAGARSARRVAVDVVPGPAAAEARPVHLPPAAREGARWAPVDARDRAAELRVAVAAGRAAVTA